MNTTEANEDAPQTAQDQLIAQLRQLRLAAGWPSTRQIAEGVHCSHTTAAEMLNGRRLVGWRLLQEMVRSMGGDPAEFKELYLLAVSDPDRATDSRPSQTARELAALRCEVTRFGAMLELALRTLGQEPPPPSRCPACDTATRMNQHPDGDWCSDCGHAEDK